MKIYRCQHCKFNVSVNKVNKGTKSAKYKMGNHYDTVHKHMLPTNMTGYQWFYFLLTKKDHGTCVICKGLTAFNETAMKYSRFCDNPNCKQKYKEERDKRMMGKYGKLYMTDEAAHQKKMLLARRISGQYTWSDGSSKNNYTGSYELDFLKYLDIELKWCPSDIISPSPHSYVYEHSGTRHFYIPDFFIPSLNLEIEIKSDENKNINQESRQKDIVKDDMMKSNSNLFNYVRIMNKNYSGFLELVKEE